MKTLEEIRDEMAQEMGFLDWEEMFYEEGHEIGDSGIDEVAKRYAKEVAKEALKNASSYFEEKTSLGQRSINVITSETNIPEL